MELEVGMYVRTKEGNIEKICAIENEYIYTDEDYLSWYPSYNAISKASYNIIDLIEVGDYVNGYKVITNKKEYIELNNADLNYDCIEYQRILKNKYSEIAINSIVTKEQFESLEYKL